MRFGIFDHVEGRGGDLAQLYRERIAYVTAADQAGFWGYFKSEHHLTPLDVAPCPSVYLAALAQHTTAIRLVPLVYLLPFHHPLRLVEEIAMVDALSGGRLEVGVGRGIAPPEHEMWGLDPAAARDRAEETFAAVRAGLGTDRLTFHGEHWHFDDVPIPVRATQRPHPPFWYPGNFEVAAPRGFNTVVGGPGPVAARSVERYRELYAAADAGRTGVNAGMVPTVGAALRVFVGADDAAADERARRAWAAYSDNITLLWRRAGIAELPGDPAAGGDYERAKARNLVLAGSPARVADALAGYVAETGIDVLITSFCWGDLDHAETMASLERYVDAVLRPAPAAG